MLKDITIGQYYMAKSAIHALDPRTKLLGTLFYMALIFIASKPLEYAFLCALTLLFALLSKVPVTFLLRGLKSVMILILFTAVLNLFMSGGETVILQYGVFKITYEGVVLAGRMIARIILLIVISSLLTLTTTPTVLTNGLERFMRPLSKIGFPAHEIAMMMSIALRFIPTLADEADKIMKAQTSRGSDFEGGGIIKKAKALLPLFVPLFVSAFRRADDLAMAMETRCYHGGENRTSYTCLKFKRCDMAAFTVFALSAAAVFFLRLYL